MKRSEVNQGIEWAKQLLKTYQITLPEFGYWTVEEWRRHMDETEAVRQLMLGWDVTDYGLNTFKDVGGVLFTVRNGDLNHPEIGVPYAEKFILLAKDQALPTHMHFSKTEDIINRAGGVLCLKLYQATLDDAIDYASDVTVYTDGIKRVYQAGEVVRVKTGCSITLPTRLYHSFWAEEADLVVGEVSSVNDDRIDNCFNPKMPRFGEIEEDEPVVHPLCNEYDKVLNR